MADQLEGQRTLPVKYKDMGDGTVAERIAVADETLTLNERTGTAAGTVTVPAGARLWMVEVQPLTTDDTVTAQVFGGQVQAPPVGWGIERDYQARPIAGAGTAGQVVISGTGVGAYYVSWFS